MAERLTLSEERKKECLEKRNNIVKDYLYNRQISLEKYDGCDIVISPLSYYNPKDALEHGMKDYISQAEKTVNTIKTLRESKGQKLVQKTDIKNVLGTIKEGRRKISVVGFPIAFYKHRFIREFCGYLCVFDIDESKVGLNNSNRLMYTLDKVYILFYLKNSDSIGKEIILRNKITRFRQKVKK